MSKKVLYFGLPFHTKTKSNVFLLDLLRQRYDVTECYYKDGLIEKDMAASVKSVKYDYLVCWQVMPESSFLEQFEYKKGILFPMYDNVVGMPEERWSAFYNFTIINFCRSLHEALSGKGYCSKYIQYFPEASPVSDWGNANSLFFWQRTSKIHGNLLLSVCSRMDLQKMHIHKALDPGHYFMGIREEYMLDITFSEWFDRKEELARCIMESAYYAAPRMYEGIGMGFLEAMAMGRCVIAPDYPTMNEYIVNGETGLLYNHHDPAPILPGNIRKIQENAYASIREGHQRWEREKYLIFEWIEEEPPSQRRAAVEQGNICQGEGQDKYRSYYSLMNKWLMLKNRGTRLESFFQGADIRNIAIYGCGDIAMRLIEELDQSEITVSYMIDRRPLTEMEGIPVLGLHNRLPETDAVVVTPVYCYGAIFNDLTEQVNCPVIALSEIMDYLVRWA